MIGTNIPYLFWPFDSEIPDIHTNYLMNFICYIKWRACPIRIINLHLHMKQSRIHTMRLREKRLLKELHLTISIKSVVD